VATLPTATALRTCSVSKSQELSLNNPISEIFRFDQEGVPAASLFDKRGRVLGSCDAGCTEGVFV
jgi:hypothetical protein